jgi:hypothetical protein
MTSSPRQPPDPAHEMLLASGKSDVTDAICKFKKYNSGKSDRIVALCVRFLTCCLPSTYPTWRFHYTFWQRGCLQNRLLILLFDLLNVSLKICL